MSSETLTLVQGCKLCGLQKLECGCAWVIIDGLQQENKELRGVVIELLKVSRECANDYEFGERGYYYWEARAKQLLGDENESE